MPKIIPKINNFAPIALLEALLKNLPRLVVGSTQKFEKLGLVRARLWKLELGSGSKNWARSTSSQEATTVANQL